MKNRKKRQKRQTMHNRQTRHITHTAELRASYFARVQPVLGEGLQRVAVSVDGAAIPLLARTLELLAGCRLGRIIVRGAPASVGWPMEQLFAGPSASSAKRLAHHLRWKNPYAPPRLSRRGAAALHLGAERVAPGEPPRIHRQTEPRSVTLFVPEGDLLAHQDLSYAAAREALEVLLGRCPLPRGTLYLGNEGWPYDQSSSAPVAAPPPAPDWLGGLHLLVVGCGSVGSEALRLLSATGARFTLLDGGRVSIFNPHRQWFGAGEVGELKVTALARRLPRVRPLPFALEAATLPELEALLDQDRPDAVLLATGTGAGALAAPSLWRRGIPHLSACAYARARFFEVAILAPEERTPCLHCLRGHLDRGPEALPPIDDELGRFLYQEVSPEERTRAYQELCAEPATPIETGRVADLAVRCLLELVRPRPSRPLWFRRLIAEGTTCLLGGNVVERGPDGVLAFGLRFPGQVVRLGLPDLRGCEGEHCRVCGRALRGAPRAELPAASEAEVTRALLG